MAGGKWGAAVTTTRTRTTCPWLAQARRAGDCGLLGIKSEIKIKKGKQRERVTRRRGGRTVSGRAGERGLGAAAWRADLRASVNAGFPYAGLPALQPEAGTEGHPARLPFHRVKTVLVWVLFGRMTGDWPHMNM
jgi:hypothetical protein